METSQLEAEIAQTCAVINAATGRLLALIAQAVASGACDRGGFRSPEHWVAWKCGVSRGRARKLVAMARRRCQLPETTAALEAGELSEDRVAVICRHAPAALDAEIAAFGRSATVTQLNRKLSSYPVQDEEQPPEEPRRVSFGPTTRGTWRLSAELPADEGALVERALDLARQTLFNQREEGKPVTWPDALVAMADRFLADPAPPRPYHERHLLLLHLRADEATGTRANLHLSTALPDFLRRQIGCDGLGRIVLHNGKAVSVGRTQRIVPERTRILVEDRDRGCRAPGCDRKRWLQIHHVRH